MRIVLTALFVLGMAVAAPMAQEPARPSSAASTAAPVNLNTATEAQLESLPGVGPAMAKRILEYRQQNGGFKKIEDLMNVRGIGETSFLKLKPLVTVAQPRTERVSAQPQ